MDAVTLLKEQVQFAHFVYNGTTADVTEASTHAQPTGTANSVAAAMAHIVIGEDAIIHGMLQGGAPLYASAFTGKTGCNDPQWMITPEWSHSVRLTDLAAFRAYTQAVFEATDKYVAALSAPDLLRVIDLSPSMGKQTVAWVLGSIVIGHMHNLVGEISAAKGFQGLKGYPF
jgi:hypothetical protein